MEDGEVEAFSSTQIEPEASRQVEDVRRAPPPLQPTDAHARCQASCAQALQRKAPSALEAAGQACRPDSEGANAAQALAEQAEEVARTQVASQAAEQAGAGRAQSFATEAEPHIDGHADQNSAAAASRQSIHSEENSTNEDARGTRGTRRGGQLRQENVTALRCARMPCSRIDI